MPSIKFAYGCTIALSAVLLFTVEPMVTRAILPQLGGSSTIWITALAFFQLVLLLGYTYARLLVSVSTQRPAASSAHLPLVGLAALSLFLPASADLGGLGIRNPQMRLFLLLSVSVGLPFLCLSTTAPLLQAWYARREGTAVPYRLFALSNLASLAALLAYPTLIEPHLALNLQFAAWKTAFLVYATMITFLALRMRAAQATVHDEETVAATAKRPVTSRKVRWLWLALPAVASLQLAAITAHLTQDVASLPLLWVVPLAAYLASFVLAFELPRLYRRALVVRLLAVLLFALGYFLAQADMSLPIGLSIGLFTAELFVAAWFCHAELFALRPAHTEGSASFYLHIAAGGALGSIAVAVVSPMLTDSNFDLPVSFLVTAVLVLVVLWREGWPERLLWSTGTVLGVYLLFALHAAYAHDALFRARNFYGSLRVKQTQSPPQALLARTLYNGNIQHGMQWFSDAFHRTPLTYYAPDSGIGLALDHCCEPGRPRRIGVVGLGAGTLAAYGEPGDTIRFYEINPLVLGVAQQLFTYTRDTPAHVSLVPGDARLSLAAEPPQGFDVLAIDAFSGDSIPTHLLTREALALYRHHLAPGGILAFHISNQYLDLAPVLARLAEFTQTSSGSAMVAGEIDNAPNDARGESLASWVLLTERAGFFNAPALGGVVQPIRTEPGVALWTDQYVSLLPILRWSGRHTAVPSPR